MKGVSREAVDRYPVKSPPTPSCRRILRKAVQLEEYCPVCIRWVMSSLGTFMTLLAKSATTAEQAMPKDLAENLSNNWSLEVS
mmetsp:Transcript_58836/g.95778  ORF Transcript_58836/g.95778 Transcript_58836/m.95778 type:complete len:83 (+) Transcript_58836:125-373(+)